MLLMYSNHTSNLWYYVRHVLTEKYMFSFLFWESS